MSRVVLTDEKVGGDLSLGESFDTLLKEDNRYLLDAVGNAVKLVSIVFPHLRSVSSWKLEGIPWLMPLLKALPEPRFVREGRTKVFEVNSPP
jgi:hypothetical protein